MSGTTLATLVLILAIATLCGLWMGWEFWGAPLRRMHARYQQLKAHHLLKMKASCDDCDRHKEDTACVLSLAGIGVEDVYEDGKLNLVKVQKELRKTRYATKY